MRLLPAALISLALACSDRTPPPEALPRDRPLAQDGTAVRGITSAPDRVKVQVDLSSVRAALQAYRVEHGAWPGSLADLKLEGRLNYPEDLAYDSGAGAVKSRTYPAR